jgi:hypothetical protein
LPDYIDPRTGFRIRTSGSAPEQPEPIPPVESPQSESAWGDIGQGVRGNGGQLTAADARDFTKWQQNKEALTHLLNDQQN